MRPRDMTGEQRDEVARCIYMLLEKDTPVGDEARIIKPVLDMGVGFKQVVRINHTVQSEVHDLFWFEWEGTLFYAPYSYVLPSKGYCKKAFNLVDMKV